MNKHVIGVVALLASVLTLHGQTSLGLSRSPYVVVERGPHHRVWESVMSELGPSGETLWSTNSYVELETGACYQENGQWVDASEGIEIHPDGAIAQHTQHKVIFAPNLKTLGAIDLLTPDGKRMRSSPVGLAYYDAASGQSVWIGGVKESQGAVLGANQVIYTNAFSNIVATVRYTVTKAGFEQDIILQEQPPAPEEFGLPSDTTRLEVVTEFYESPVPDKTAVLLKHYTQRLGQQALVSPDFKDEELDFGAMRTGRGRAFKLTDEDDPNQGVDVGKHFGNSDGRTFMIEGVEYEAIRQQFSQLPETKKAIRTAMSPSPTQSRTYPPVNQAPKTKSPLLMAQSGLRLDAGVVIDYILLGSTNNFTFRGDTTYFVTNNTTVTFSGISIIEGGSVVKYSSGSGLSFSGSVKTDTSMYRPAILTARDDDSIGDKISGSTGVPSGYYGIGMTVFMDSNLQYLYCRHLSRGVIYSPGHTHTISHSKFFQTFTAFTMPGGTYGIRNVLFDNVNYCLYFYSGVNTCSVENATANTVLSAFAYGVSASLTVTNTLFAQCAMNGYQFTSDHCATSSTTNGVFQVSMNGGSYLGDNIYRNMGTTNINASLLADLRKRTTYAPVMLSNTISANSVLSQQVPRDTDVIDYGYHYDPVDYMVNNLIVTNATLTLTNGVSVGYYGTFGFTLRAGAAFVSEGTPDQMNRIVHYQAVQDRSGMFETPASQQAIWTTYGEPLDLNLRFTELPIPNRLSKRCFFNIGYLNRLVLRDCQIWNGFLQFNPTSAMGVMAWTNNLAMRINMTVTEGYMGSPASLNFLCYNNTFLQSVLNFKNDVNTYPWNIYDNLFDNCSLTNSNTFAGSGYNAYINMSNTLGGNQNVILSSFNYDVGTYGAYYQRSPNMGSRSAANAALYQYTTQTNNVKEGSSTVDIGFHYVAANNSSGIPNDQDGDGLADYYEDYNGNGICDGKETDYTKIDSDGDNSNDYQEYVEGTDPLNASSFSQGRTLFVSFDDSNLMGENGQLPKAKNNLSILDGYKNSCVNIDGTGAYLSYNIKENNQVYNMHPARGSIRFWFKPNWSSVASGGSGPGLYGRILEIGNYSGATPYTGWWGLTFTPDGNSIHFGAQSNNIAADYVVQNINWVNGSWHWIELSYGSFGIALYVDSSAPATYSGNVVFPNDSVCADSGLRLGSDLNGNQQAKGCFDNLEVFNHWYGYTQRGMDISGKVFNVDSRNSTVNINLSLFKYPSSSVDILRRPVDGATFTTITTGLNKLEFTDSSSQTNVLYEYKIPTFTSAGRYLKAGINMAPIENRGVIMVLCANNIYSGISAELSSLTNDLICDGWQPLLYSVPVHDDSVWSNNPANIALIKNLVVSNYNVFTSSLKSIYLIGHVTIPYTGVYAWDGHNPPDKPRPFHNGAWPCDGYYGNIVGTWNDNQTSINTDLVANSNSPNDGKYDEGQYSQYDPDNNSSLEIPVGRADFSRLIAFQNASSPRNETDLTKLYLNKVHNYKYVGYQTMYPAMIWTFFDPVDIGFPLFDTSIINSCKTSYNNKYDICNDNIFTNQTACVFGIFGGYGLPNQVKLGQNNYFTTTGLAEKMYQSHGLFNVSKGSYFGDHNVADDNLLRAFITTSDAALAVSWSMNEYCRYDDLFLGGNLGDCFKYTVNRSGKCYLELIGDPTLRFPVLKPSVNLRCVSATANAVSLEWTASSDAGTSYYVYRGTSINNCYANRITPNALTGNSFTDNNPPAGTKVYMIRALKKEFTGCGSYMNISQGVWLEIQ